MIFLLQNLHGIPEFGVITSMTRSSGHWLGEVGVVGAVPPLGLPAWPEYSAVVSVSVFIIFAHFIIFHVLFRVHFDWKRIILDDMRT